MKIGDLVKHRSDGELGVCVGVPSGSTGFEYLVTWFDWVNLTVSYNIAAAKCHVEVLV